jgi:hypothetical protein
MFKKMLLAAIAVFLVSGLSYAYKDGEDGVNRTNTGKLKSGQTIKLNPQPLPPSPPTELKSSRPIQLNPQPLPPSPPTEQKSSTPTKTWVDGGISH